MVYGDFSFFFLRAEIFVLTLLGRAMFDFEVKNMTLTGRAFCCENKLHIGGKIFYLGFFLSYFRRNIFRYSSPSFSLSLFSSKRIFD